jgi:flagellar hook-basal body complex protein FliE
MNWALEPAAAAASQAAPANLAQRGAQGNSGASAAYDFANLMERGLSDLNASVGVAETSMRDLAAGKSVELHEVMINLERARIGVQTFVQVRNKLIESYQDLMRMQL